MPYGPDIPKPKWHKVAKGMSQAGIQQKEIARLLDKGVSTVRGVLRGYITKSGPVPIGYKVDHKRYNTRAYARQVWRDEGRKLPLEHYYRRFECL